MSNLIIVEHDNKELKASNLHVVTAAQAVGGDIDMAIIGHECQSVAEQAVKISGIGKVIVIDSAEYANILAESAALAVVELADGYSKIWAVAGTFGKNLMPRAAALLDIQQISDISAVLGENSFERPIYAGNAISHVESGQGKDIITVRITSFEAAAADGGNASIVSADANGACDLSKFLRLEGTSSDRPELTGARVVISGGRGMQSGDNFAMLERVAAKLGAAVGASRAAVDAGFAPNDYQVGQTGKVVAPDLYIAVGISGAIQHLAGMKDSKIIVAINKDDEAPIFQVADYGLVADLFEAIPELESKL